MGQKTVNLLTDHQGPLLSLVAALERAVARSVLSRRPTWPQRALAPIRERVLRDTVERYRTQTHALCLGLQKGHAPARTQLVALVDEAFANLRAGVREEARRRGLFLGFLAQRDARFAACEALEIGDDPKRGADLRIGTMIILHAFVRDVVGYDRFVDLLLPLANGRGPTRILDLAAGHVRWLGLGAKVLRPGRAGPHQPLDQPGRPGELSLSSTGLLRGLPRSPGRPGPAWRVLGVKFS